MKESIRQHVPLHKGNKRAITPGWSKTLTQQVKEKYKAWKKYARTKTDEDLKAYTRQRNKTTLAIRKARSEFENRLAKGLKHRSKALYRCIRSQLRIKARVPGPLKKRDGKLTETEEVAEELNAFFKSVFVSEQEGELPEFEGAGRVDGALLDIHITHQEVNKRLQGLSADKAAGPDGIPSDILKECADATTVTFTILFNKTLETGEIPIEWKQNKTLLTKLEGYNIGGKTLKWIAEFLSDRKQRVVEGAALSQWAEVTSGVPQGSVLECVYHICE